MLSDQTAMRAEVRRELADFHAGRAGSFCIRSLIERCHQKHGFLKGTVLAAVIEELDHHALHANVALAAAE